MCVINDNSIIKKILKLSVSIFCYHCIYVTNYRNNPNTTIAIIKLLFYNKKYIIT